MPKYPKLETIRFTKDVFISTEKVAIEGLVGWTVDYPDSEVQPTPGVNAFVRGECWTEPALVNINCIDVVPKEEVCKLWTWSLQERVMYDTLLYDAFDCFADYERTNGFTGYVKHYNRFITYPEVLPILTELEPLTIKLRPMIGKLFSKNTSRRIGHLKEILLALRYCPLGNEAMRLVKVYLAKEVTDHDKFSYCLSDVCVFVERMRTDVGKYLEGMEDGKVGN